jgi:hypothetical protein
MPPIPSLRQRIILYEAIGNLSTALPSNTPVTLPSLLRMAFHEGETRALTVPSIPATHTRDARARHAPAMTLNLDPRA